MRQNHRRSHLLLELPLAYPFSFHKYPLKTIADSAYSFEALIAKLVLATCNTIPFKDALTGLVLLYFKSQRIASGVRDLHHVRMAPIQNVDSVHGDDDVANFKPGRLRWGSRFDSRYYDRFRAVDPEAKLARLSLDDDGFVTF